MNDKCHVCGLPQEVEDHAICPCCGIEFGYDDVRKTSGELRLAWLSRGAPWFSDAVAKPYNWHPLRQLQRAGMLMKVIQVQPQALTSSSSGVKSKAEEDLPQFAVA